MQIGIEGFGKVEKEVNVLSFAAINASICACMFCYTVSFSFSFTDFRIFYIVKFCAVKQSLVRVTGTQSERLSILFKLWSLTEQTSHQFYKMC